MLRVLILVVLAASCLIPAVDEARAADVYIVAGQSNGYRISSLRAGDQPLPDGRRIFYYGMACVSEPERSDFRVLTSLDPRAMGTSMALELLKLSEGDIIFVQYCRCGSGVGTQTEKGWYPGDDPQNGKTFDGGLFAKFQKYVAHAEQTAREDYDLTWTHKGLFWHQGENDSNGDRHLTYERNLTNLFCRFRQQFGKDLPIVCGEIRELTDGDRAINQILAKVAANDSRTALAKAADLQFAPDRDGRQDVHFALEGCQQLGRRMATEYRRLIEAH